MRRLANLSLILVLFTLTLAMVCKVNAQVGGEKVNTFLDSEMPGIRIQANATAETKPAANLTVWLSLTPQTNVYVEVFRLEVYGFLNGTTKVSIGNITDHDLPDGTSSQYSGTFPVQEEVWGVTFGEITLTYFISLGGGAKLEYSNSTSGFYMTDVENTFLEKLEDQLNDLNETYTQLNDSYNNLTSEYAQLNQTYVELNQNYTKLNQTYVELNQNYTKLNQTYVELQGSMNELDNTRRVAVILGITSVFFVVTTVFMVMRRPKESW